MLAGILLTLAIQQTGFPASGPAADETVPAGTLTTQAQDLITRLVLIAIPHEYDDEKHWGRTTKVQSGLNVRFDDGRLRTKRRWKSVNHGRWQKYSIRLVDPVQRFTVHVANVVHPDDQPLEFDLSCSSRIRATGRWQEWQLGVSLLRLSAELMADVTLSAHCVVDIQIGEGFPPEMRLVPKVEDVRLQLTGVRLKRISHLKGTAARELGRSLEAVLVREVERRGRDLERRINKELAEEQDHLTLSPDRWW